MANKVGIDVSARGAKSAASDVDRLRDRFTKLQQTSAKGLVLGAGAGAGLAAFNAAGMALRAVTGYLGDSAEAYREDRKSVASLTASLWANVKGFDGNVDAIEDVIAARQKLGFSDDEQRASLDSLVAVTHDVSQALNIQRTAMDLARMRSMDLGSATELLSKVAGGNVGILKRYGIQIKEGATATEALAAIQKMAAGQAEAYAATVGKTEVAQQRAAEASEKFGEQVDRLQGFILPVAADAIEGLANQVDALSTVFDDSVSEVDRLDSAVTALNSNFMTGLIPGVNLFVDAMEDEVDALRRAQFMSDATKDDIVALGGAAGDAADDGLDSLNDELKKTEAAARDAEREIDDLADTLSDALFGDAINAGNLADLKQTHKELLKQREEVEKGTPKWRILTGEIAENEQAMFDLQLQMKEKEGPRAVIEWLKRQKELFGDQNGLLQQLIDKYKKLIPLQSALAGAPLSGGIAYTGANPGAPPRDRRGAGGPVVRGRAYTVGEAGPETFVAPEDGHIIPTGGGLPDGGMSSWGWGGTTIIVQGVSVLTPGSAEALARQLEPIITRKQQRRGQVAAPRPF